MKCVQRWVTSSTLLILAACGGGDTGEEPVSVMLKAELTERGTYLECRSSRPAMQAYSCPDASILAEDFTLSTWEAVMGVYGNEIILLQVDTRLPAPIVLNSASGFASMPLPAQMTPKLSALRLQALDAELRSLTNSEIAKLQATGSSPKFTHLLAVDRRS